MSKFLKVMAIFLGICGVIGSFVVAYYFGNFRNFWMFESSYTKYYYTRDWTLTIEIFFGALLSTAILTSILYSIGTILDNQDIIINRLYEINESEPKDVKREADPYKEWKCPNCGNINANYVGMCSCGTEKPNE